MQSPGRRARPPFRWAVLLYDRWSRRALRLDLPAAQVGPALCVEVRRSRGRHVLPDGTSIRREDLLGILHLNNARLAALHLNSPPPSVVGIAFRRRFIDSLVELARLAAPAGPFADVRAYSVTTILSAGLERLGFRIERGGVLLPRFSAACQRYLLASLHPKAAPRLKGRAYHRSKLFWLTRDELLARYGAVSPRTPR